MDVYETNDHVCYKKQTDVELQTAVIHGKKQINSASCSLQGKTSLKPFPVATTCISGAVDADVSSVSPYDEHPSVDSNDSVVFDPADYYKKRYKPIVAELENKTIRASNYGEFDNFSHTGYIGNIPLKNNLLPRPVGFGYVFRDNPGY